MARCLAFLLVMALLYAARVASAEADTKTQAREHFERGVAAFNQRRFGDAAEEFQSAYRLSPAFSVLYNIGQVNVALGRAVEAVDAFEQYLAQGGAAIPEERKAAVRVELERQRALIGTLVLRVQPEGAEIRIDGKSVGKAPVREAVRVMAGKRTIMALLDGYTADVREVQVASRAQVEVELRLEPVRTHDQAAGVPPAGVAPGPPAPPAPAAGPIAPAQPAPLPQSSPAPLAVPARDSGTPIGNGQRTVGYVVGGLGIAVAAVGTVLAVMSVNDAGDAVDRLSAATTVAAYDQAKPGFDSDLSAARKKNALGWAGIGLGGAITVTGLVLIATAPAATPRAKWTLAPWKTAECSGLLARATW
jgi:tetratricopeptide (TPR) repeat protein